MKKDSKKLFFKANKFSGIEASVFFLSIVVDFIRQHNRRGKFMLPFYSMTMRNSALKADEWIIDEEYEAACDRLLAYIKKHGYGYFTNLSKTLTQDVAHFRKYTAQLMPTLPALSNPALIRQYNKFTKEFFRLYSLGVVTFLYESIISNRLTASLGRRYKNVGALLPFLMRTKYKSFMVESEKFLMKIKKQKDHNKKEHLLNLFLKNFFFIRANTTYSPLLDKNAIRQEIGQISSVGISKTKNRKRHKVELLSDERLILNLLRVTEIIRDQRKLASLVGFYGMARFIDQAIQRRGIRDNVVDRLFWYEYKQLINQPKKTIHRLRSRQYTSLVVDGKKGYYLNYKAVEERNRPDKNILEIKGTPTSTGKAIGRVCVVFGSKTFAKFKAGNILVTENTRPDFVPIMRKAAAIVTDEGGLTSHAAIVAREMGKPCVVGTKIATQVFKDGDIVEVDATKGVVRKI